MGVQNVHITVHNCSTQYNTEQFWQFSFLSSRESPLLRCCLLEDRMRVHCINTSIMYTL